MEEESEMVDDPQYRDELAPWRKVLSGIKEPILVTKDFIVYLDSRDELDWQTSDEWDETGPKDKAKHHRVLNRVAELETIPCADLIATNRAHFRRLIGEGLARSFKHEYALANTVLDAASRYIDQRSSEVARAWYLQASMATALPCLVLGFAVWVVRDGVTTIIGSFGFWCVLAACSGSGGALLSVIARQGKIPVDCVAGKNLHQLEGASRILAGCLSAFLSILAVHSGLILTVLAKGPFHEALYLVVGFSAGFAERLVSSIVQKVDLTGFSSSKNREGKHHEA